MVAAHKARTDVNNVSSMGRDGSGIRMMMWAGATMEAGPRAGQAAGINSRPSFPFGGIWPIFGNDGKRFFNETITRHGSVGYLDMMPEGQKMVCVTDSNWDAYCEYQAYDHQAMDRSNEYMLEKVRKDMANYKTGPDGFSVQAFARYSNDPTTLYAADTLEELADIMGFILLYGKKNVSRYGFRHSVLEATRRPVCHVILQRCAGRDMLAEVDELLTAVGFVQYLPRRWAKPGCEDKFWQGAAAGMDVLAFGLCACTKLDGIETTNTGDLSVYLAHSADYEQITVSTVPAEKNE